MDLKVWKEYAGSGPCCNLCGDISSSLNIYRISVCVCVRERESYKNKKNMMGGKEVDVNNAGTQLPPAWRSQYPDDTCNMIYSSSQY